ncbi:glycosyltransferase [Streptantibioticus rubrisoli]|uniref:D-inositol 3-phosphate glycosyltransferase n=1 Tax=Streptantibioticus rubrisoli TaxID=1387313 RepID=A0ABT1PD44_9ACTN|nr:glycosyltransferase [Streptantibioticus rubrisoli]MCQ4042736.1 glycosyltransferase [Streptantibioticus rubrisoli]
MSTVASTPRLDRGAALLTAATVLVGAANYGLSLLLVRLLPPSAYAGYAAVSSVLLTVGTLASATVPWVLAREVAVSAAGSARRRQSLRCCLRLSLGLSVVCAAAACAAVSRYAGPALLAVLATACVLIMLLAAAAGYLQGRQDFGRLGALRVAEVAVRVAVAVAAAALGWGSTGVIGAFAVGAGVAATAGLLAMRRDLVGPRGAGHDGHAERRRHELWRQAAAISGIQTLVSVLLTLDVLVAAAVRGAAADLATYQALLVLARVPLFLATALAMVVFPRLAAARPAGAGRAASADFRRILRLHWITAVAVTAVVAACPPTVLGLLLPARYASAAGLLLPLGLAGLAAATVNLLTTLFQAWGPVRPVLTLLGGVCLVGAGWFAAASGDPRALAWSAAAVFGTAALLVLALVRRRVSGLGPATGATAALVAGAAAWGALTALRSRPVLWGCAAVAVCALAAVAVRPRRRGPGPYRVLHLGFEDPRQPGAGGGSVRTHEVNRRLAARGIEVTVACARWPGAAPAVVDGVRYLPFGPRLGPLGRVRFVGQLGYFAAVLCGLWLLVRRTAPDVVVEDFAAPFSSLCVPYLTGRPVVGVVQWLFARDKSRQYKLPFAVVERLGVASHRRLVAVSEDLADELRRRNPAASVTAVPNGLEPAAFHHRGPGDRRDLLFLGRLEIAQKGLDLLLRAFAEAAPHLDARLRIAGDGPDEAQLRALADELGIADRVDWLGRVSGAARFDLLADARLVCMPSRYETFGMVAAEALATGTPVLAYDIPCLRALVGERVGVRVPAGDVGGYAKALAELAADPERCAALGAAGPASVRHLDWDRIARAQLAVYRAASGPVDDEPLDTRRQLRHLLRDRGRRPGRALLIGNYGNGNTGDESILFRLAELAGERRRRLTVVSRNPGAVARLHRLAAVRTTSLLAVRAFLRADAIAVGGGGMFGRGLPPLVRVLPAVLLAARLLGKEVHIVAIGAYPDTPQPTRWLLQSACRHATAVTVRDTGTRRLLSSGPARWVRPALVPDPAASLAAAPAERVREATGVDPATRPLLVSLKPMPDPRTRERVATAVADALREWDDDRPVVFLCLSDRGDYGLGTALGDAALSAEVARRSGLGARAALAGPGLHPAVAKGLVRAASGIVAMRLHAQIYAVAERTELFGISFEPKSDAWLAASGLPAHRAESLETAAVARWLAELPSADGQFTERRARNADTASA